MYQMILDMEHKISKTLVVNSGGFSCNRGYEQKSTGKFLQFHIS